MVGTIYYKRPTYGRIFVNYLAPVQVWLHVRIRVISISYGERTFANNEVWTCWSPFTVKVSIFNLLWKVFHFTIIRLAISWQWRKQAGAACTRVHTLFVFCLRAIRFRAISLDARDLELSFANMRATSLPGETGYSCIFTNTLTSYTYL